MSKPFDLHPPPPKRCGNCSEVIGKQDAHYAEDEKYFHSACMVYLLRSNVTALRLALASAVTSLEKAKIEMPEFVAHNAAIDLAVAEIKRTLENK